MLGIDAKDSSKVEGVRQMMEDSGLGHSFDANSENWYWNGTKTTIIGSKGSFPTLGEVDLTEANMGKNISLNSISELFSNTNASKQQYSNFINGVYGSAIGFMNYTDLSNQSFANGMLANVYNAEQLSTL